MPPTRPLRRLAPPVAAAVLALAAAACADRANPVAPAPVPREPLASHGGAHPIRRTWTAAAGTTDWHTAANWLPNDSPPASTDTAVVPSAPAGGLIFPSLAANVFIGGLEVDNAPALVNINAFDLTLSGSATTSTTGLVDGTVGRVILVGIAQTVGGIYPRVRVTGTYSLDANLTLDNNLRVEGGRLRNTSFRVRVNNP